MLAPGSSGAEGVRHVGSRERDRCAARQQESQPRQKRLAMVETNISEGRPILWNVECRARCSFEWPQTPIKLSMAALANILNPWSSTCTSPYANDTLPITSTNRRLVLCACSNSPRPAPLSRNQLSAPSSARIERRTIPNAAGRGGALRASAP